MRNSVSSDNPLRNKVAAALLSVEAFVFVFLALVSYGLKILDPLWAFGGGVLFTGLFLFASRVVKYRWGYILGWVLQLSLIAMGFLISEMFIIGLVFAALWVFSMTKASQLGSSGVAAGTEPDSPHQQEKQ